MNKNSKVIKELMKKVSSEKSVSAWDKGVKNYALVLLRDLLEAEESGYITEPITRLNIDRLLLNGARNWKEYSWGGCFYIYNSDIADSLCTPSELKRTKNGSLKPNAREEWLDVQARALFQASKKIYNLL